MGCRHHPEVHRDGGVPAQASDLLLLEDPQEFDLDLGAHLADLVQEDRAALGRLELALVAGAGARERPRLVSEELALQEALGEGAAIHDHEGVEPPGRARVDCPGHELLAGARLAR